MDDTGSQRPDWRIRVGFALVVIACLLWGLLFVIPLLPITTGQKAFWWLASLIAAEVLFWVGAVVAGPAVIRKYRRWIDPRRWFAKERDA